MPNIKSQKDRVVQSKKEALHNKAIKSNLKTVVDWYYDICDYLYTFWIFGSNIFGRCCIGLLFIEFSGCRDIVSCSYIAS